MIRDFKNLNSKSMSIYYESIKNNKPLTQEEEVVLIEKIRKGDKKAKVKLLKSNLRFVIQVANLYKNKGIPLEDLVSEGNLGLIKAVDMFSPEKNFKFISYAMWQIRAYILRFLAYQSRPIKFPPHYAEFVWKTRAVFEELEIKYKTSNVYEEVAEIMDKRMKTKITTKKIEKVLCVQDNRMSFDSPTQSQPDKNFSDIYFDPQQPWASDLVENDSEKEMLYRALDKLKEREREIICLRHGIGDMEPHKLLDIAIIYTLTRERIRQIVTKAEAKLRDYITMERMVVLKERCK